MSNKNKTHLPDSSKNESLFEESIQFDMPKNKSSVIKVIGVGGGGNNAVNYMFNQGILGVDYVVCNTDAQALNNSPVPIKLQLGVKLTEGLGAGADPKVGEESAIENTEEIKRLLQGNTKMVFITAGMGGGTGTGAAPIVASIAKEMGILTVGIVTIPFTFEGKRRLEQAEEGIKELRKYVDSLIVINNNKLREVYGNLGYKSGFSKADEVLLIAARGIAEVITRHFTQNIDLKDAETVLQGSGTAIMGSSVASGENRAKEAISQALDSPLLNDNHIKGAQNVLLLIVSGKKEITVDEIAEINEFIQKEAGGSANIIMGAGDDDGLEDEINLTVIATGFEAEQNIDPIPKEPEKVVFDLHEEKQKITIKNTIIKHQLEDEEDFTKNEIEKNSKEKIKQELFLSAETKQDEIILEQDFGNENIDDKEDVEINEIKDLDKSQNINQWEKNLEKLIDISNNEELPTANNIEKVLVQEDKIINSLEDHKEDNLVQEDQNVDFSLNFSVTNKVSEEIEVIQKEGEKESQFEIDENNVDPQFKKNKRSEELKKKLKSFNYKINASKEVITQLENQPAFERQGIELEDVPHSSESKISKYTLTDPEEKGETPEIRPNNSFLHDNVD